MGLTVYGGGGKPEEEKTVTAGTSVIEVNPSSGKVMKKVTVNPTPTESKSVTPTTSKLTVTPSVGKHLSQVVVGAVEDVTPEVTAQTPVITQIAENLGVAITTPSGTNKQILQGNNANLLNIKNNAKKEGVYVWKKLTAEGGDFVDFVVSDQETAYPDGGGQGGYWYEKFDSSTLISENIREGVDIWGVIGTLVEGKSGIDFGEVTFSSQTNSNLVVSHSLKKVPSYAFILPKTGISSPIDYVNIVQSLNPIFGGRNTIESSYNDSSFGTSSAKPSANADNVTFKCNSYSNWEATSYIWVAIA